MSGTYEHLHGRRPFLQRPELRLELAGERELEPVQERERVLAHDDDELRLDDVQLADEERPRLVVALVGELEAVRPVDRHRVDVQPLQRLEDRLAGAPEEGDALLDLRRLRPVLEEHDVGAWVPGSEHGHTLAVSGGGDLVAEVVDLGDRLLEVLLIDLVGRH